MFTLQEYSTANCSKICYALGRNTVLEVLTFFKVEIANPESPVRTGDPLSVVVAAGAHVRDGGGSIGFLPTPPIQSFAQVSTP